MITRSQAAVIAALAAACAEAIAPELGALAVAAGATLIMLWAEGDG